mmetsp:Transcript_35636/g.82815  ORF Transcript_35636/g.82815 Transcript_35636/m.82815 type:complete len:835 (-) Transcript_35636:28-2532(-)
MDAAHKYLWAAVQAVPQDHDALLALGSFYLRRASTFSQAQRQLLMSAKSDPSDADPFALLGLWYEEKGDIKRSEGCFNKALILDPAHPVAGRGLLRFVNDAHKSCARAADHTSSVNGWAWAFLGQEAEAGGDDTLSLTCYQQALFCSDVAHAKVEFFYQFYTSLQQGWKIDNCGTNVSLQIREDVALWTKLGGCYHRLGKLSAAVQAYTESFVACGHEAPHLEMLCDWAQAELSMGMHDEAYEKCSTVLITDPTNAKAAHVAGVGALALARRCHGEGKYSMARKWLEDAIDILNIVITDSTKEISPSIYKLRGDLYTFGASLPYYVFLDPRDENMRLPMKDVLQPLLQFVQEGYQSYADVLEAADNFKLDDLERAVAWADMGINCFFQLRISENFAQKFGRISSNSSITLTLSADVSKTFLCPEFSTAMPFLKSSIIAFLSSLKHEPHYALAWCGLGTVLARVDPLLAQHCLCRSLQLDKSNHIAWTNMSMLLVEEGQWEGAEEALDALTQVADSPICWIGRGLLIEAKASPSALDYATAADAYRSALQVSKHSEALLRLAMTCRRAVRDIMKEYSTRLECNNSLQTFIGMGNRNMGLLTMENLLKLEEEMARGNLQNTDILKRSIQKLEDCLESWKGEVGSQYMIEILDAVKSCLAKVSGVGSETEQKITETNIIAQEDKSNETNEQKNHSPDDEKEEDNPSDLVKAKDPIHLLHQVKLLVQEGTNHYSQAQSMASEAYTILHQHLMGTVTTPPQRSDDESSQLSSAQATNPVDAHFLAEALALVYWLCDDDEDENRDEAGRPSEKGMHACLCLQRTLLIDPGNALAVAALNL